MVISAPTHKRSNTQHQHQPCTTHHRSNGGEGVGSRVVLSHLEHLGDVLLLQLVDTDGLGRQAELQQLVQVLLAPDLQQLLLHQGGDVL